MNQPDDVLPHIQWVVRWTDEQAGTHWPDGYGLAWREWQTNSNVLMPMPLNVIASVVRSVYWWMRRGFAGGVSQQAIFDARESGYTDGREVGYRIGLARGRSEGWYECLRAVDDQRRSHPHIVGTAMTNSEELLHGFRA